MEFLCTRDCFIQVSDPDGRLDDKGNIVPVVNLRAKIDETYKHDSIDFTDYSRHFKRVDAEAPVDEDFESEFKALLRKYPKAAEEVVSPPKDEFSGVIPGATYAEMARPQLVALANERRIEDAGRLNMKTLVKRLQELDDSN